MTEYSVYGHFHTEFIEQTQNLNFYVFVLYLYYSVFKFEMFLINKCSIKPLNPSVYQEKKKNQIWRCTVSSIRFCVLSTSE